MQTLIKRTKAQLLSAKNTIYIVASSSLKYLEMQLFFFKHFDS